MNNQLDEAYKVRYIKLHFTLEFAENSKLPVYKASALRGGMGEMLLRAGCIRDRDCDICDFEKDCNVRRIMYAPMDIQPTFMTSGESVGYIVECEDYREFFIEGDKLSFNLILFGKTIVCFSQILSAIYALGISGIGKELSRFNVVSVTNSRNEELLQGNNVIMTNLEVMTIADYISYRKKQLDKKPLEGIVKFQTPASIKYKKEQIKEFNIQAVIEAACRRIYMLDCFEGIRSNIYDKDFVGAINVPDVISETHREVSVRRFSNHQKAAMYLKGIEGELMIDTGKIDDELIDILLAGELIHIGKNISFGFGRYRLK